MSADASGEWQKRTTTELLAALEVARLEQRRTNAVGVDFIPIIIMHGRQPIAMAIPGFGPTVQHREHILRTLGALVGVAEDVRALTLIIDTWYREIAVDPNTPRLSRRVDLSKDPEALDALVVYYVEADGVLAFAQQIYRCASPGATPEYEEPKVLFDAKHPSPNTWEAFFAGKRNAELVMGSAGLSPMEMREAAAEGWRLMQDAGIATELKRT